MKNTIPKIDAAVLILAGILTVVAIHSAFAGRDDLADQRREYCEMVELYRTSQGEFGWPDFRNNARNCK